MNATEQEPRRLTPTERLHDIARTLAEKPAPVSGAPYFKSSQTKATGGTTVFEWDVYVPVCEEFPTSELAFEAHLRYARAMRAEYGPTNGGES